MGRLESVFEKFTPFFLRFANAKPTLAIKDGFILTMPMTIIGSLFLLILAAPIPGWEEAMVKLFENSGTFHLPRLSVLHLIFWLLLVCLESLIHTSGTKN